VGVEVGVVVALRDEEKKDEAKEVLRDEEEEGGLRGEVRVRDEDTIVRGVTRPLMLEMRETSQLLAPLSKQLDPKRNENWRTVKLRKLVTNVYCYVPVHHFSRTHLILLSTGSLLCGGGGVLWSTVFCRCFVVQSSLLRQETILSVIIHALWIKFNGL